MSAIVTTSSSHGQNPKGDKKKKTSKIKRKEFWSKSKKSQVKREQKSHTAKQILPPADAQQFSANWKTLQETLVKQPEKPQPQNGAVHKKSTKNIIDNNTVKVTQKKRDFAKPAKKIVKSSVVVKDSNVNDTQVHKSHTTSNTTKKRKVDLKNTRGKKEEAKKLKTETKPNKPTEEDIWFDDVDPDDIEATVGTEAAEIMRKKMGIHQSKAVENALVKEKGFEGLTKAVAIDCEMVGVGLDGEDSILARVSLVNQFGKCIFDKFVKPTERVTDYRTHVSGIRPEDIKDGEDVDIVRKEVAEILRGRIVVGHAIHNDLKILLLDHPKKKIRDTQKYEPFKKMGKSGRPALRVLCREVLNVIVQQGEHSSVQDAQATMRLYTTVKKQWEAEIKAGIKNKGSGIKRKGKAALAKTKNVRTGHP
ncbi:RNA exonuclease 4-like [Eucyclogobius newberryi]|uniref:RNA exonuclease 4-like n=1 Tax=Eucyclogobius newberryi TaxID=166745 RepID=UPI003B5C843F